MARKLIVIHFFFFLFFLMTFSGWTLSGEGIADLKQAGVSDQTIQVIVAEKVIETAAYSVGDIVDMKMAGVSDETLRMLIKEGSFLKNSEPIVYGQATRSLRFTSVQDVIALKKAGLSDAVIQAVIAASAERYYSQQEEAFDLLRDMDIRVDFRRGAKGRRRDTIDQH
jgi:hypothetical protein